MSMINRRFLIQQQMISQIMRKLYKVVAFRIQDASPGTVVERHETSGDDIGHPEIVNRVP